MLLWVGWKFNIMANKHFANTSFASPPPRLSQKLALILTVDWFIYMLLYFGVLQDVLCVKIVNSIC